MSNPKMFYSVAERCRKFVEWIRAFNTNGSSFKVVFSTISDSIIIIYRKWDRKKADWVDDIAHYDIDDEKTIEKLKSLWDFFNHDFRNCYPEYVS